MWKRALFVTAACGVFLGGSKAAAQGQPLLYTVPYRAGDGGYRIFRIPALWYLPKKPLCAFAEGRIGGRRAAGDIDLCLRRSFDQGQTWEPLQVVADFGGDFCGNPCVVHDPTRDRLWLAFTRSRGADVEEDIVAGKAPATQVWIVSSDDDGATWSTPRDLGAAARREPWGWYGTGPGLGLFLGNAQRGRLVIPAYHTEAGVYRTHCLLSDDHGETWRLGSDAADDTSEPQVVELADRTLLMNARTIAGRGERRTLRLSRDRGETWEPAADRQALVDAHCQGCIYRCFRSGSNGQFDLIYAQPSTRGRVGVQAWISEDDGRTWPTAQPLWSGPSAYTSMVRLQSGLVGLLLECGTKDPYEQIAFVKFAPEWLKARRAPP